VDERTLIAAVRAGDPAAERQLYEAHVDRVYRLAYRMTGDDTLAQDCTQDTFVRVFDRLGDFRGDAALSTWIHAVATSVVLNALRTVKRLRGREMPEDEAATVGHSPNQGEPILRRLMHDVEGYTHEEIGGALGVPVGTSKAQLFRARARLREALAGLAGEGAV